MQETLHTLEIKDSSESGGSFQVSYLVWNHANSDKNLFCIHGVTRNCRDFDYLARALRDDYRVVCPDIVGRGESKWLENKSGYHYGTYCQNIISIVHKLSCNKIDFIGTSMGGIIGMYLAAYHPHLIGKLVLNDIGPYIDPQALKRIIDYISVYPTFFDGEEAEIYLRSLLKPFGIQKSEQWNHVASHSIMQNADGSYNLKYDPGIALVLQQEFDKNEKMDFWSIWRKINVPILVLRGEKSDILTKETLKKMIKSKEDIEYSEYPSIGHAPSLMEENQINDVKEWLLKK